MQIMVVLTVEVEEDLYSEKRGFPVSETADNLADEFRLLAMR
jgi:hypothetical protein